MAGLLDLFSGRSSDIYGEGLLTPEQRGGLGNIGLLALAGKLGQLAGPSFSPVPDFGAALGQAAGAYGASQEGAGTAALNAILTAQKGRKLQQELDFSKQLGPILSKLAGQWPGADGGTAATPETGSTGGGAAAPLGAGGRGGGGTGGWGPHADTVVATLKEQGFSDAAIQGILANGLAEGGFASPWVAGDSGNSLGHWQFNNRGEMPGYLAFVKEQGGNPQDSRMQALYVAKRAKEIDPNFAQIDDPRKATDIFATKFERYQGAAPGQRYGQLATVQQRLGGGAPTAAAPADGVRVPYNYGAPSGGLLAPNPLSDAEPMVGIPRPAVARQAAAGPLPIYPGTGPEEALTLSRIAPQARPVEARQAQLALTNAYADALQNGFRGTIQDFVASRGTSGGGGPLAAPPGAGGDPIMSVTSADQAGGGEPPRAALPTMGPTGVELPPMQGPLAAPAPAAAAPAAPGPGLLSPPGAPAAAALPRVNPAYDAYLRNLAVAGALSEGAGLKNVFGPLTEALKASPAFQAQLEIARKAAGLPFVAAETTAKKAAEEPFDIRASERALGNALTEKGWRLGSDGQAVRIPGYDKMEEATAFATAKGKGEGELPTTVIIKSIENQNKIIADAAANGNQVTFDKDGKMSVSRLPGADAAAAASAAATTGAQERAKAEVAAGTAPDIAGRTKLAEQFGQRTIDQLQSAEDAQFGLQNTARVRPLVDKMIAGYGADTRLEFGRALKAAGLSNGDGVVATQTYLINQLDQASRVAKRFGSGAGITERDVENAKQLVGGSAQLDKQSLLNILDMVDRANRRAIELQHQGYDRLADGGKTPVDRSLYKVPIPIYTSDHVSSLPAGTPVINPKGDRGVVVIDDKGNRVIEPERPR